MDLAGWTEVTEEIFYASERLVGIGPDEIALLKGKARSNKRKRCRLCAHNTTEDITQEMIIALCAGNYVRPHKHLGKSESFHVIEGMADFVFFDEEGRMTGVVPLGDYASGKTFYYRIAEPVYHSVLVRSDIFVVQETTRGPYVAANRTDTVFAAWAPQDGDTGVGACMRQMEDFVRGQREPASVGRG